MAGRQVKVGAVALGLILLGLLGLLVAPSITGPQSDVVEYRMVGSQDIPAAVALGSDGAVWFTIDSSDAVGVLRDGRISRLARGGETLEALGIAADATGGVWLTDISGHAIRHLSGDGALESVPIPGPLAQLGRLAVGPDGATWFADSWGNSVTRLDAQGLTPHLASEPNAAPFGVAVDAGGTVWSTLQVANKLMRIGPDGDISELDLPSRSATPTDVAVDHDGGVWFSELRVNKIGYFREGRYAEYDVPGEAVGLTGLAVAPDGSVWFTELRRQRLARLRNGTVTEFPLGRADARPFSVAVSESGDVWYTDLSGWVGKLPADRARSNPFELGRLLTWAGS